jgi:hypothetical protein
LKNEKNGEHKKTKKWKKNLKKTTCHNRGSPQHHGTELGSKNLPE